MHFFASLILSLSHNTVISDNATDNIFFRNFKLTFILIICNTTLSCKLLTLDMSVVKSLSLHLLFDVSDIPSSAGIFFVFVPP